MNSADAGTVTTRAVAAGRGWGWVREGFALLARAPATWLGVTVCFFLALLAATTLLLSAGPAAAMLLTSVLTAGIMLGCRDLAGGAALGIAHLGAGLRGGQLGALLGVGAVFAAGATIIALLAAAVVVAGTWDTDLNAELQRAAGAGALPYLTLEEAMPFALAALIAGAALVPLIMATWLAPALVQLRGAGALASMRLSFAGCRRNLAPLLVYGLVLLGVTTILGLAVTVPAAALISMDSKLSELVVAAATQLCTMMLTPILWTSTYAAYADIYEGSAGA